MEAGRNAPELRNALNLEIRARHVRQIVERAAPNPPALQLPEPHISGGFIKLACTDCHKACWQKVEDVQAEVTCRSCQSSGFLKDCAICCSRGPRMSVPSCHNDYCAPCVGKWMSVQIDEGLSILTCPMPECKAPMNDNVIKSLGGRGFISQEKMARLKENRNVGRHSYLKYVLSGEDLELTQWAMTNTQSCPHCFALVQKSTGCTHITCTCKGEFCYICGEAYPLKPGHRDHARTEQPRLNPRGLEVMNLAPPPNEPTPNAHTRPSTGSSSVPLAPPRTAEEARSRIAALLTLQCPSCERAVCMEPSFDSCFSLRCASCPTNFCAWCFRPATEGEDPHTHVLDCTEAPEDMRGSALYLHDTNGGPHVPPNPHRKFEAHWRSVHRRRALAVIESAEEGAFEKEAIVQELDAMLMAGSECQECS